MEHPKKKHSSIVIVAHKFLPQPDDDLVLFLNNHDCAELLHIYHGFADAPDRRSVAVWYKEGREFRRFQTVDYKAFPEIFIYLKETLFTWSAILRTGKRWNWYIGMDGLCVFWGNLFRFFGVVRKTVYWAIDFVPQNRFASGLKNRIYHAINMDGYRRADEMWDLSPRMSEAREKFLGMSEEVYRSHKVVPYGMWLDRIRKYPYEECEKNTLVFMGHLLEKQGVQLIIRSIPELVKHVPNFKFKIIGTGSFKDQLVLLARENDVLKYCEFHGKIEDNRVLEDEIARSAVAVAPYVRSLDNWTYYADPGKVKSYLGCGVPVLLTDIPWNAGEIERKKCGIIISEESQDIVEKIVFLMKRENNIAYRENAIRYAQAFDYKNIFEQTSLC